MCSCNITRINDIIFSIAIAINVFPQEFRELYNDQTT